MTRTRIRGGFSTSYQRNTDLPGGVALFTSASAANGLREGITDVSVPRFNKLRAHGEVFVNPLQLDRDLRTCPTDTMVFASGGDWGTRVVEGTLACHWSQKPVRPAWFATRVADAKALTLTRAHAKVGEETFQGMVTVAEARKTALMLKGPFAASLKLIDQIGSRYAFLARVLLKGRMPDSRDWQSAKTARDLTKAFANAWNEYRFGWRPVLRDIQNIVDAYVERNRMAERPVRIVARSKDQIDWLESQAVYTANPPGLTSVKMSRSTTATALVSSGVLYELFDEALTDAASRRMGLRLSDVPATLWELAPYSFVVDRFAAVGDWLKAITPKPGVRILGQWTTVVDKHVCQHRILDAQLRVTVDLGKPTQRVVDMHQGGGAYTERITSVTRNANPLLPILPPINTRLLDLEQQIDHAALITQRLMNLLPKRR
jgi:hypothetical protein